VGGGNAVDFVASGEAVCSRESRSWRWCGAIAEQSAGAALDDAFSTPNVEFFCRRPRTRLRLLLELQMVRIGARRVFIFGSDCLPELGRRSFWRSPTLLLSLYPMVV
jgi:hypothetical protein